MTRATRPKDLQRKTPTPRNDSLYIPPIPSPVQDLKFGVLLICLTVLGSLVLGTSPARGWGDVPALYAFEYGDSSCDQWDGLSCTLAIALQITVNPCSGICSGGDADGVECAFVSSTYADTDNNSNCSFCLCGEIFWGWARATSSVVARPPGPGPEIAIEAHVYGPPGNDHCPASATILASGQVPLWNYQCADPTAASSGSWQGLVTASVPDPAETLTSLGGIARRGCFYSNAGPQGDSGALYLRWNSSLVGGVGIERSGGLWTGEAPVHGVFDEIDLTMKEFLFDDGWMDVTKDGRFNRSDVDALPSVDPKNPENLQFWDFDRNGAIDEEDVLFMDSLVTAKVDSGFFGDLDRDGVVCASDAAIFSTLLDGGSIDLRNSSYLFAADWDLDGRINQTDLQEFNAIFATSEDCNCNGIDDEEEILRGLASDENGNGIPDECDCALDAEPVFVVHGAGLPGETHPYSGMIDPRAESDDCRNLNFGPDRVTFVFSTPVRDLGGKKLTRDAFRVFETGEVSPPQILSIQTSDNVTVEVLLDRPITPREWTTIVAEVEGIACGNRIESYGDLGPFALEPDRIDLGFLPGDTNQDRVVSPTDLLYWRQLINGVVEPWFGTLEDFLDTNRDGRVQPLDLIRFRQILAGACPAVQVWSGEKMNSSQP